MAINAQEVIFVFPGKTPADLGRSSFSPNFLSQSRVQRCIQLSHVHQSSSAQHTSQ